jgi:hypothetical protein
MAAYPANGENINEPEIHSINIFIQFIFITTSISGVHSLQFIELV